MSQSTIHQANNHRNALPIGSQLDVYRIEKLLGHGGFGMTYYAIDCKLEKPFAIKEFLPQEHAVRVHDITVQAKSTADEEAYDWGLKCFLQEAKTLASISHTNIVKAVRFFQANNTAYLVMEYEQGESLDIYLKTYGKPLPEQLIKDIFNPLLDGLHAVHKKGLLHRDIKPANIYLRQSASPMLIDFGAARYALGEHSRSLSVCLTPGYAPHEQYSSRGKQGAWTDLYGVGASLYKCMAGKTPVSAEDRAQALLDDEADPYLAVSTVTSEKYSPELCRLVDVALAFKAKDRPQTIEQFKKSFVRNDGLDASNDVYSDEPVVRSYYFKSISVAMSALVLIAGVAYYAWDIQQSQKTIDPIIQDEQSDKGEQDKPTNPVKIVAETKKQPSKQVAEKHNTISTVPDRIVSLSRQALIPSMVNITGSCYQMGSPDTEKGREEDERQHQVCVDDFQIGKNEVTVGEFRKFVHATDFRTNAEDKNTGYVGGCNAYVRKEHKREYNADLFWDNVNFFQNEQYPVVCVNRFDVQAYISWLNENSIGGGYRLPTEAEWEYAARGGAQTTYSWGNEVDSKVCRFANVSDESWANEFPCHDGYSFTAPVGSYKSNKFGLHDMLGNVSELTCSEYEERWWGAEKQCLSKKIDSKSNKDRYVDFVMRGGSFDDGPRGLRVSLRGHSYPFSLSDSQGFRLARTP